MFKHRIIYLIIFFSNSLFCADYGRWSDADQYTAATVITGVTNTIRRLAIFDGLTFANSGTAATYTSMFPISGNVNLAGGTLTLGRELRFGDVVSFVGPGKIYGSTGVRDISFPGTLQSWAYTYTFQDVMLRFESDLNLRTQFTFQNTCTVDGGGSQLDLRNGGSIFIAAGANLTFQNISIVGLNRSNVQCMGTNSTIHLDDTALLLSGTYVFTQGSVNVINDAKITGTGAFAYKSAQNFRIRSKSSLLIDNKITFSYDSSSASALVFEDNTSTFILNGATLYATANGINLRTGNMKITTYSYVASEETADITIGNDAIAQDFTCLFSERTKLELLKGSIAYRNVGLQSWIMLYEPSELVIDTGAKLKLYQSLNPGDGNTHFRTGSYLLLASGKTIGGSVAADNDINYGVLP